MFAPTPKNPMPVSIERVWREREITQAARNGDRLVDYYLRVQKIALDKRKKGRES